MNRSVSVDFDNCAGKFSGDLRRDDIVLVAPSASLTVRTHGRDALRVLSFPWNRVVEMSESARQGLPADGDFGALHRGPLQDQVVVSALRELADVSARRPMWERLEADGLSCRILARLLALKAGNDPDKDRPATMRRPDRRVRHAMEYIDTNLSRDLGLLEVASAVGLKPTQLNSLFKRGLNVSPHRWRILRRLERSCRMLQDEDLSITEIALACGFASSQHFSTAFKRHRGVTPSGFRARTRE